MLGYNPETRIWGRRICDIGASVWKFAESLTTQGRTPSRTVRQGRRAGVDTALLRQEDECDGGDSTPARIHTRRWIRA